MFFGREEDIAFLDNAWANHQVNVVTIVAWAGVGKSMLVNHWLRQMAIDDYRSAELIFGWSFYRQGSSAETAKFGEITTQDAVVEKSVARSGLHVREARCAADLAAAPCIRPFGEEFRSDVFPFLVPPCQLLLLWRGVS